jgi:hypothetical protein
MDLQPTPISLRNTLIGYVHSQRANVDINHITENYQPTENIGDSANVFDDESSPPSTGLIEPIIPDFTTWNVLEQTLPLDNLDKLVNEMQTQKSQKSGKERLLAIRKLAENCANAMKKPVDERKIPPIKTIAERLKGKEGRPRTGLMGMRTNFATRTVANPDTTTNIEFVQPSTNPNHLPTFQPTHFAQFV